MIYYGLCPVCRQQRCWHLAEMFRRMDKAVRQSHRRVWLAERARRRGMPWKETARYIEEAMDVE